MTGNLAAVAKRLEEDLAETTTQVEYYRRQLAQEEARAEQLRAELRAIADARDVVEPKAPRVIHDPPPPPHQPVGGSEHRDAVPGLPRVQEPRP